jgi:hypothetical protein
MAFGDSDLGAFFADMGVAVTFNGITVQGLLDQPMELQGLGGGFGGVDISLPELTLPYNAFSPMPVEGSSITVAGTQYTVAKVTAEADGSIVCFALKVV